MKQTLADRLSAMRLSYLHPGESKWVQADMSPLIREADRVLLSDDRSKKARLAHAVIKLERGQVYRGRNGAEWRV